MGVGKEEGAKTPWILKFDICLLHFSAEKGCFHSFEREKWDFTTFVPLEKSFSLPLEKSTVGTSLEKIPPTSMIKAIDENTFKNRSGIEHRSEKYRQHSTYPPCSLIIPDCWEFTSIVLRKRDLDLWLIKSDSKLDDVCPLLATWVANTCSANNNKTESACAENILIRAYAWRKKKLCCHKKLYVKNHHCTMQRL